MFDEYLSKPGKRRRPSKSQILAVILSAIIHLVLIYGLYRGKITIKFMPAFSDIRTVVIAPAPKIAYPVSVGGESSGVERRTVERPVGSVRAEGGSSAGRDAPSAEDFPDSAVPAGSRSASPGASTGAIPALSETFHEALMNRIRPRSSSGLLITLSPPGQTWGQRVPLDLRRYPFPGRTDAGSGTLGGSRGEGGSGRQRASLSIPLGDYDLTPWAERVIEIIQGNWDLPAVQNIPSRSRVRIFVTVGRSGQLTSFDLLDSSALAVLDQAAIRAVRTSLPFPPLPTDFPAELLEAYFEFIYND